MKKIIHKLLILGIVSLSVGITGCNKEEVEKSNFTILENTVYLKGCNMINEEVTNHTPTPTYRHEVTFYSSGVAFNAADSTYSGKGSYITVDVYSSEESDLLPGTYTFDIFYSNDDFTIQNGYLDYYQKPLDQHIGFGLKYGVLEVSRLGNTYTFEIDLLTDEIIKGAVSYPVKGFYTGTVNKI